MYVGNVHSFRRPIGEKCIKANKHVLLEKPFACSSEDAEYLVALAKERNLFLMEVSTFSYARSINSVVSNLRANNLTKMLSRRSKGMWTRFFPAVEQARRLVFGSKNEKPVLGEVVSVHSDFNFNAADSEDYPSSFLYQHQLGGGASLLVAPYPIAAVTMFFGGATPDQVKVVGQVDKLTGVDLQANVALSFPPTGDVAPAMDDKNTDENTPKLPG